MKRRGITIIWHRSPALRVEIEPLRWALNLTESNHELSRRERDNPVPPGLVGWGIACRSGCVTDHALQVVLIRVNWARAPHRGSSLLAQNAIPSSIISFAFLWWVNSQFLCAGNFDANL
jgi:hypothetical protein